MNLPDPERHHLEISSTARYYTLGEIGPTASELWFVLHGYGQRILDMVEPFRSHRRSGRLIVIPEGLSRFYLSHKDRTIGASWMTAEDRKAEIRDYIGYLNRLVHSLQENGVPENTSLTVLGFSQGSATATRWLADGTVKAQRLILWGGIPAFELCTEEFQTRVLVDRIQMVTGTEDRYTSPERMKKTGAVISKNGRPVEFVVFEGPHEIHAPTLTDLMEASVSDG